MPNLLRRHALLLLTAAPFSARAAPPVPPVRPTARPGPAPAPAPAPADKPEDAIGQYGTPDSVLTIYEQGGALFADGATVHTQPAAGMNLLIERQNHKVTAAILNGVRMPRHDFGAEVAAKIRARVKANPAALRAAALAARPPVEPPPRHASDLVELRTVDPRIKLDVRYATANNFMGFALYERAEAYLQRAAAEALGRAQKTLAAQGFGLLIHDGYRPWFVTKMFWDATPQDSRVFVADPAQGSRHNRGCAVDLTLYNLKTGKAVEMPSRYDEMSTRSYADFVGGTTQQRALRAILRTAMEAQGFIVYPQEWWHFDYKDWASYGIGTLSFTELAARAA